MNIPTINLGSYPIPINAATKTFAILAKRGAGKTYTAGVMAEEFSKNPIPFVVFDPIDVWWGLRLSADGKGKGLPIVVFGLDHADIPLTRDMGRQIAQAIVQENISCVISTFGMPKAAMRHLIAEFADELLNINNTPRHVFIEEAHEFVPQRVMGAMAKTFPAVEALVVMGRNRGIGVTLINQRAATINKDVLTQLDTLLAFRNVSPQDRKALKDWVEYHAAEGDFETFMASLPSLPTGEGWIWSPEFLGIFKKINIRKRETFHPDREKIGDTFVMPGFDQVDIQGFIQKFTQDKREAIPAVKPKVVESRGKQDEHQKENSLIAALKNEYESQLMTKDIRIRELEREVGQLTLVVGQVRNFVGVGGGITTAPTSNLSSSNVEMWVTKLGGGAGRILTFLAEKAPMKFTRSQIALAIRMSSKGGTYNAYIQLLKRNNLIVEQGGEISISPDL
jgi:hypothetical protein